MSPITLKCQYCERKFKRAVKELNKSNRTGSAGCFCSSNCHTRWRREQLPDSIVEDYIAGQSTTEIGEKFGVSDECIRRRLHKMGVVIRPKDKMLRSGKPINKGRRCSSYVTIPDGETYDLNAYNRAFRATRKAKGLCINCREKATLGMSTCEKCRQKRKEYKERRFKEGHCYKCNAPRLVERRKCQSCVAKERLARARQVDRLRIEVFARYGGPHCVCCGEATMVFLTIDHISGNGAEHRRQLDETRNGAEVGRHSGRHFYRWLKRNGFPEGYQVLCFNCNFAKWKLGQCPHQDNPPIPHT